MERMKLAVCFYGQPRFYNLYKKYNNEFYSGFDVNYYCHFWEENIKIQNDIIDKFKFKKSLFEPQKQFFRSFEYFIDTSCITKTVFETLSPLYSMNQLHNLIEECDDTYDYWILTRPDVVVANGKLSDKLKDKSKLYLSYVTDSAIPNKWIGTQMVCGTKQDILNVTNIYNNLDDHLNKNKIPLCHHRLYYDSLKYKKDNMEILNFNTSHVYGGWYWIRNNGNLSDS